MTSGQAVVEVYISVRPAIQGCKVLICRNSTIPQGFDVALGGLSEETAVLAAELAQALIADCKRCTRRIEAVRQHPLPGCL